MINLDNQEEKKEVVHVTVLVQTDYDIDPVTGTPVNVVSKVIPNGSVEVAKSGRSSSKTKKTKITLESIAENYPVITLAKSYYKMNKVAATVIGALNEDGEHTTTLVGNRIRLQLSYIVEDPATKITTPIIVRDDEEKLVGAQQVRDSLSVGCSGQPNYMLSQFGQYFYVTPHGHKSNEVFKLEGYTTLLDLLKAIGAEIPEELRGEEAVDVNEVADENLAAVNGADSSGEEFIPDESLMQEKAAKRPSYVNPNQPEISGATPIVDELGDIDINDI